MSRRFQKQPNEKFPISIDYSANGALPSGTALVSGTVEAVNLSTNAVDNSVLSGTTTTIDVTNKLAKITVQAGSAGTNYKITFLTTLDDTPATILEDEVVMEVIDL